MARNRNDSTGSGSRKHSYGGTPYDAYRKQIGRQNSKNAREDIKRAKLTHQKKENAPQNYKDVLAMVFGLFVLVMSVYALFYALLSR